MLRMSNLIMWDEQTESWWQHIEGKAIVGDLAGAQLQILPAKIISLNNYLTFYPEGKTLFPKIDTSYETNYDINNYVRYDSIGKKPFLFFKQIDKRLPAMEYVFGLNRGNKFKAYTLSALRAQKVINDQFENQSVVVFYNSDMISNLDTKNIKKGRKMGAGTVFNSTLNGEKLNFTATKSGFQDKETKSEWNFVGKCIAGKLKGKSLSPEIYSFDFAFAWLAYHPESEIYSAK